MKWMVQIWPLIMLFSSVFEKLNEKYGVPVEESPDVTPPEELSLPSIALDMTEEHHSFVNCYNDQCDNENNVNECIFPIMNPTPIIVLQQKQQHQQQLQKLNQKVSTKKETAAGKHPILDLCSCRKACNKNITEARRRFMHNAFWQKSYDEQNQWLLTLVKRVEKQRNRRRKLNNGDRKARPTFTYGLRNEVGTEISVCQKMLLSTFGNQ